MGRALLLGGGPCDLGADLRRWLGPAAPARRAATLPGGREVFPGKTELHEAGLGPLHEALRYNCGFEHWAEQFGLPYVPKNGGRRTRWPKQRVERELREFVAGRAVFPGKTDFELAGMARLYGALVTHGGIAHWAECFGLPTSAGTRDRRREMEERQRRRRGAGRRGGLLRCAVRPCDGSEIDSRHVRHRGSNGLERQVLSDPSAPCNDNSKLRAGPGWGPRPSAAPRSRRCRAGGRGRSARGRAIRESISALLGQAGDPAGGWRSLRSWRPAEAGGRATLGGAPAVSSAAK